MFRTPEQANFASVMAAHLRAPDAPLLLEGGVGIGKTRAYLHAAVQSGQRIAIVVPTHQLIDQLLASADLAAVRGSATVAAFRPARMFERRRDYDEQREAAAQARIMVCTAASVVIDQRLAGEYNGSTAARDYLIFDEADQLPDMAALQSDLAISRTDLDAASIRFTTVEDTLRRLADKAPRTVEPEVRAAARVMIEVLAEPRWFQKVGLDDDGAIVLTHKLPGRLLKKVANRPGVAFVSATLTVAGRFDDFRNTMGIGAISRLSTVIEPQQHGRLSFRIDPQTVDTPEWIEATVAAIKAAPRPCLVATTSHDLSARLGERVPGAIVRDADVPARTAAEQAEGGVLISAGAWAGLDTPTRWRAIVVPRVPYGQPVVIDGQIESSYLDARNTAVRRLRQVIGRGLRTPDAVCEVTLLDARAERLPEFVPVRFRAAWSTRVFIEGARTEVMLSKAERDPALRRAALSRYGHRCQACSFVPTVLGQLDVHHKSPIKEGERKTRLEDVAVLCANCHRLAHAEDPPVPVERLAELTRDTR